MNQPEELDEELRRLFADERLAVPPGDGAETAILAGARRIRRRRRVLTATGGALAAVALVGTGLLVSDLRSNPDRVASPPADQTLSIANSTGQPTSIAPAPPAASPTSTEAAPPPESTTSVPRQTTSKTAPPTSSTRVATVPQVSGPVLGPTGYSKLKLGMSFQDAKSTGLLANADSEPAQCTYYTLTEGTSAVSKVKISPTDGVVAFLASGAHTPEQIQIGSTKDQLEAAYPGLSGGSSLYSADAGGNGTYMFTMSGDKVSVLSLIGPGSDC
ncbi:hypothetical protein FPZ12_000975 [Amycolatopsis acidicola]|uniref:Uncharacterized protein n=1 Tax=Amycolatopsis acidicola TaxID=2596893 RepID=A0A5N0VKV4_9PSEU|nr:hypothetical protein [Amycolatopsis acidicola]KAA9166806.1 hypothetical protein FPZ12_000975 [Amycolatopsis acidicola]